MTRFRVALRSLVRLTLRRAFGENRARVIYEMTTASRDILWNSARHRLYPSYWRQWLRDRRRGVRTFAIHGEFGDAVAGLPLLYREHQEHPEWRVAVVIRGHGSGVTLRSEGNPFAERGLRVMADGSGRSVNFLREFWSRVPFVAEVREGDVTDVRFRYFQPHPAFALQGRTVGPSDYRPFMDHLFTVGDSRQAESIWEEFDRPIRVAAHLRRSAAEIASLVEELDRSEFGPRSAVAIMGSRRHEPIPELNPRRIKVLDLTDNYEKGIPIMPLLQVIRSADLFLGGRGGFEVFALASGVPAVTVFDDEGWWEQRRLWPQRLWTENPLGCLARASEFDARRVFVEHIAPWLRARVCPAVEFASLPV